MVSSVQAARKRAAKPGVLTIGTKTLPTPAPILPTYRGQLPYLPAPVWRAGEGGGTYALAVSAADVADHKESRAKGASFGGRPLDEHAALPPHVVSFLLLRGAAGSGEPPTARKGSTTTVLVQARASRIELDAQRLALLHQQLATDCVEAPWAPNRRLENARKMAQQSAVEMGQLGARGVFAGAAPHGVGELTREHLGRGGLGVSLDVALLDDEVLQRVGDASQSGAQVLATGGVGEPGDVLQLVGAGATLLEVRFPFALAERGEALDMERGVTLQLRDACYARDGRALIGGYTRAYLHHLLAVHEMLAPTLLAKHNALVYTRWFDELRAALAGGTFEQLRAAFYERRAQLVAKGCPRGTLPL